MVIQISCVLCCEPLIHVRDRLPGAIPNLPIFLMERVERHREIFCDPVGAQYVNPLLEYSIFCVPHSVSIFGNFDPVDYLSVHYAAALMGE